jgi:hypothetical protein
MTDRKPDLDAVRKSVTLAARMLLDLDDWGARHAGIALALAQALDALGVTDEVLHFPHTVSLLGAEAKA